MHYKVVLYYKYVHIENPEEVKIQQKNLCEKLNLKGRIIIAKEGINGTLEGNSEEIEAYCRKLVAHELFEGVHIKLSEGTGTAFPKLSIKVRTEIVSAHLGNEDVNPNQTTGKYISAEELHDLINSKEEFYIIDMRNDYEHAVGYFDNSILMNMRNFRDLPKALKNIEHLKNKKIVTVCTGGVRCEKASGFLITKGFSNVSQLYGGIVTYMEKYPNDDFLGELYVFDNRIVMGFNLESPKHKVVGKCEHCEKPSTNYINCAYDPCHKHFICCTECTQNPERGVCAECVETNMYARIGKHEQ